jgi:hypothetical protein
MAKFGKQRKFVLSKCYMWVWVVGQRLEHGPGRAGVHDERASDRRPTFGAIARGTAARRVRGNGSRLCNAFL